MRKLAKSHPIKKFPCVLKQVFSFLLLLCVIVLGLPIPASAASATSGSCGTDATWSFDENTGTLTISGTGDIKDYEEYLTYWDFQGHVKGRPAPWVEFGSEVKNVIISPGITGIGHYAFQKCNITSISIPDSVSYIGAYAFSKCAALKQVDIPYGVELLYAGVFYRCDSLTTITIPSTVTTMYGSTFKNCSSLRNIVIPDGVEAITGGMFEGCTSLESISIPESVHTIERDAFNECDNLKDIYYDGTRGQWNKVDVSSGNNPIKKAAIHYNGQTSSDPYDFFIKTNTYAVGQFTDVGILNPLCLIGEKN